jgi:hypothetical protein
MNTELNEIELRQATARAGPADAIAAADVAAGREAFLSLGAAVEIAAADFDEAALVSRLKQSCVSSAPLEKAGGAHGSPRRGWWLAIVGGALAAAMLFAVARLVVLPSADTVTIGLNPNSDPTDDRASNAPAANVVSVWHDPLDDELALAAATIEQLAARRSFDGSLWQMNQRLEALSQELSGESL